MRSLIVGATGCAGSHLADYLLGKGYDVFGTKRETSSVDRIQHLFDKMTLLDLDLEDSESIAHVIEESDPDQIYFLASPGHFAGITEIDRTAVDGTLRFFETLLECSSRPRIVLVSSSAVYGAPRNASPIRESDALLPATPYALGKVFQEEIAEYYNRRWKPGIMIARSFNHPGPGENPDLVCSDFAKQIVQMENGRKKPVLYVGRLDHRRDFTDVRDIVRGYALLAEQGRPGEAYNLCSGQSIPIRWIVDRLLSLSRVKIEVEVDSSRFRSGEVNVQTGDPFKIFSETGWRARIPIERTLEDILTYQRGKGTP